MVSKLKNELNAHMTGSERGCQFSPGQLGGKRWRQESDKKEVALAIWSPHKTWASALQCSSTTLYYVQCSTLLFAKCIQLCANFFAFCTSNILHFYIKYVQMRAKMCKDVQKCAITQTFPWCRHLNSPRLPCTCFHFICISWRHKYACAGNINMYICTKRKSVLEIWDLKEQSLFTDAT